MRGRTIVTSIKNMLTALCSSVLLWASIAVYLAGLLGSICLLAGLQQLTSLVSLSLERWWYVVTIASSFLTIALLAWRVHTLEDVRPKARVTPRTSGQWAYLNVQNLGSHEARFELIMKGLIIGRQAQNIEPYRVQWREAPSGRYMSLVRKAQADLNVAEVITPPGSGKCFLRFHSASSSQAFDKEIPVGGEAICDLQLLSEPPLQEECSDRYCIRIRLDGSLEEFGVVR